MNLTEVIFYYQFSSTAELTEICFVNIRFDNRVFRRKKILFDYVMLLLYFYGFFHSLLTEMSDLDFSHTYRDN